MDRLDTRPVIIVQRFGKQASRPPQHCLCGGGDPHTGKVPAKRRAGRDRPGREPRRNPVPHLGGGRPRIGDAQDAVGRRAVQHQTQHAVGQQLCLAGSRIGRDERRTFRVGRRRLLCRCLARDGRIESRFIRRLVTPQRRRCPAHRASFANPPFIDPRQMVIQGKGRAFLRVRTAGIGHRGVVKPRRQTRQTVARPGGIPVRRLHGIPRSGLVTLTCQPPIFHLQNILRIDTLKAAMRGNRRLGDQLRAPSPCHIPRTGRASGLVIEDGQPAGGELVDPVGARREGHRPGRGLHLDGAAYLRVAVRKAGAATGFGLDEPGGHRPERRPPEMAHCRDLPERRELPPRHGQ